MTDNLVKLNNQQRPFVIIAFDNEMQLNVCNTIRFSDLFNFLFHCELKVMMLLNNVYCPFLLLLQDIG